jgi:small subunit ribosomal protein S4
MLALCECRLDNIVYRLGLSPTRAGARQLVTHRHVTVNGRVCNVPSAIIRPGDVISLREKDRDMIAVIESLKRQPALVNWLSWDAATMQGSLLAVPSRSDIPENIEMQLIVEFFSR